jgi:hypothetical protein
MADALTILCVTRGEACVLPLLRQMGDLALELGAEWVLGLDGEAALAVAIEEDFGRIAKLVAVQSDGYLESVHDTVLAAAGGDYVFRLDDDESCSEELRHWLTRKAYTTHRQWSFPRQHLWATPGQFLVHPILWPDYQTRLSQRAYAGGRTTIHCPSPFGKGVKATATILHHKFLIRPVEERALIAGNYEMVKPGAGTGKFQVFATPEWILPQLDVRPVAETTVRA